MRNNYPYGLQSTIRWGHHSEEYQSLYCMKGLGCSPESKVCDVELAQQNSLNSTKLRASEFHSSGDIESLECQPFSIS